MLAAAVPLLLLFVLLWAGHGGLGYSISEFGLLRCLAEFSCGAMLSTLWRRWRGDARIEAGCWAAGLAMLAAWGAGVPETLALPFAFAALLLALALGAERPGHLLAGRAIHWLGEISYATYLSHFLLFFAFKLAFVRDEFDAPPASIAAYLLTARAGVASAVLYHGRRIERPAQRRHYGQPMILRRPGNGGRTRMSGSRRPSTADARARNDPAPDRVGPAPDRSPEARMTNTKLTYVDDDLPGLTRRKAGRGWGYYDAHGTRITDRDEIDRLNAIGMPPAYKDCWFCPSPHGHIQAIGYDDKGRKQYRYHLDFRAAQDAAKYEHCVDFGHALPLIRRQVDSDLAARGVDKRTAVAAVVRLLDLGHVRVGNDAYQRDNGSFGATTLRNRHAKVTGSKLKLCYLGKSGKTQTLTIEDRRLSSVVKRVQDLPGQRLFQYLDDEGERHNVTSGDVNDYLREASGGPFTAKHFRTWGASVIAYKTIVDAGAEGIGLKAVCWRRSPRRWATPPRSAARAMSTPR